MSNNSRSGPPNSDDQVRPGGAVPDSPPLPGAIRSNTDATKPRALSIPVEADASLKNSQFARLVGMSPQEELRGLATAFDEERMKGYLNRALFGTDRPSAIFNRCTPTKPFYIPGECCVLRYQCQARNCTNGEIQEPIVIGRVFPNQSICTMYMSDRLAPLAARMHDRPEVAAFAAPAAMIESLNMVVHVWPIDAELPTLVEATDRHRMIEVFREMLPETHK